MKHIKKAYIWPIAGILTGILMFAIGVAINIRYNRGYAVTATVSQVEYYEVINVDSANEDNYTAYGTYTVDGKTYYNVELGTYTSKISEGDKVAVIVDPQNPAKILSNGGGGILIGFGFNFIILSNMFLFLFSKQNSETNADEKAY